MRDAGDRGIAAGNGGEFNPICAGDCGNMVVPGDLAETDNGEANDGHALVPAYQEDVDALPIPPQHNCAETASGLGQTDALRWIGSFSKPAAKNGAFWVPSIRQTR